MGSVLYYSNYCDNSKKLLSYLTKSTVKDKLHYVCIDKRVQKNNATYIILENNQELLLPNTINAVPALMILNGEYDVLFGDNIIPFECFQLVCDSGCIRSSREFRECFSQDTRPRE